LTASDFKHRVSTANGEAKAAVAMIDVLEVGRIRLEGIQAMVLEDKALQSTLVGMNVLNRLARYKVEGKVLVLEQ
jgi:aspartyl protease family protein